VQYALFRSFIPQEGTTRLALKQTLEEIRIKGTSLGRSLSRKTENCSETKR
jgi:hypothetical protein